MSRAVKDTIANRSIFTLKKTPSPFLPRSLAPSPKSKEVGIKPPRLSPTEKIKESPEFESKEKEKKEK